MRLGEASAKPLVGRPWRCILGPWSIRGRATEGVATLARLRDLAERLARPDLAPLDRVPGGWRLRRLVGPAARRARSAWLWLENRLIVRRRRLSPEELELLGRLLERLGIAESAAIVFARLARVMTRDDLRQVVTLLAGIGPAVRRPLAPRVRRAVEPPADPAQRPLNILIIAGEFPNPIHGGGGRLMDFIALLSRRHNIYLFSVSFSDEDLPARERLLAYCRRVDVVPLGTFVGNVARIKALVAGVPIDVVQYEWPRALSNYDRALGAVHCYTCHEPVGRRLVLDARGQPPTSERWARLIVGALRGLRVEVVEAEPIDRYIVLTEDDGRFLGGFMPGRTLHVVNHGIDPDEFGLPDRPPEPATLLYVGNYRHYPNRDAVHHFMRAIYPVVAAAVPEVVVYLVGANPDAAIAAYHDGRRVIVTGTVPDVRPYIQRAALCLAPIVSGAGLRTKVIQYAALRRACVATTMAAADLVLEPGREIAIADEPGAFAAEVVALLREPARAQAMAAAAQAKARALYDNRHLVAALVGLYRADENAPGT